MDNVGKIIKAHNKAKLQVTENSAMNKCTVIVRVYAATFSPNFMSKSRGASYILKLEMHI